jgi:hypothetical protein
VQAESAELTERAETQKSSDRGERAELDESTGPWERSVGKESAVNTETRRTKCQNT